MCYIPSLFTDVPLPQSITLILSRMSPTAWRANLASLHGVVYRIPAKRGSLVVGHWVSPSWRSTGQCMPCLVYVADRRATLVLWLSTASAAMLSIPRRTLSQGPSDWKISSLSRSPMLVSKRSAIMRLRHSASWRRRWLISLKAPWPAWWIKEKSRKYKMIVLLEAKKTLVYLRRYWFILEDESFPYIHRAFSKRNCVEIKCRCLRSPRNKSRWLNLRLGSALSTTETTVQFNQGCDARPDLPRHTSSWQRQCFSSADRALNELECSPVDDHGFLLPVA